MWKNYLGINPYRRRQSRNEQVFNAVQYLLSSIELAALLFVPLYRKRIQRRIRRPVALLVVGAQKSGTTWMHAQFREHGILAVSDIKECHHFDRGRMFSLSRYLEQFDALPEGLPIAEVAPDYGPLSSWRIRAVRTLFPECEIVFIARNPMDRAWSGTKMETTLSRGLKLSQVPVRDMLHHLLSRRSLRYGDYTTQINRWRRVFGAGRIRVFPFDLVERDPEFLLRSVVSPVRSEEIVLPGRPAATEIFKGATAVAPPAIDAVLRRTYAPLLDEFVRSLGHEAEMPYWKEALDKWKDSGDRKETAPECERICLYLCGFTPNANSTSAGQKLAYAKIRELAASFKEVRLVYFTNELDSLDVGGPLRWPENVMDLGRIRIVRLDRIASMLLRPNEACFVSVRRRAIRRVLEEQLADPAITDFYADFSQGLAPVSSADLPLFIFRQHDILSRLFERRAANSSNWLIRKFYLMESWRTRRWERRAWRSVCALETLTRADELFIRSVNPKIDVKAFPVRGSMQIDPASRNASTIVPRRIGFWGNMARQENIDAVVHFCSSLFPSILEKHSDTQFWIIGAHPAPEVLALQRESVHVTGFVSDPSDIFASLAIAVAPLRSGSGVKIKVYETIDSGIPTVASPVGAEGIEPHSCLHVAENDEDMIKTIVILLGSVSNQFDSASEAAL